VTVLTSPEADNPTRWRLRTRVPDDWIDLAGTSTTAAALGVIRGSFAVAGVDLTPQDAELLRAGLDAWRDLAGRHQILIHGLVHQGAEFAGETALGREIFWDVTGTVTELSAVDGPVSLLEVVRRVVAARLGFDVNEAYTEAFRTGIGPALGVTTELDMPYRVPGEPEDAAPRTRTVGLAVVVTAPKQGGPALVLSGWSLDPAQRNGLGMLLAAMAGPATIVAEGADEAPSAPAPAAPGTPSSPADA